jgi:PAS domain-containing protein
MIRVVCCYCKKPVKTLPSESDEVSHGVCDRCLPLMARELGQPMQEFLDELIAPVLVVQDNARVISANAAARKLLSKEQLEICGELAGDVIGCRHAREPGGCGRTQHCKSCAIRQCVTHTLNTGEACRKKAFADIGIFNGDKRVRFLIETEKVNSFVRLTIHDVREG